MAKSIYTRGYKALSMRIFSFVKFLTINSYAVYTVQDEALLTLVETLLEVAKLDSNPTGSRHSALHGIQLLTARLGSRYSDRFLKVYKEDAMTIIMLCTGSNYCMQNKQNVEDVELC